MQRRQIAEDRAIFWDFDGTLVKADAPWSNSFLASIRKAAPESPIELADVRPFMQKGFTWDEPDADHTGITGARWWIHMERHFEAAARQLGFGPDQSVAIAQGVRGNILMEQRYHVYHDAVATLARARSMGYRSYVLSNNYPELEQTAGKLGIADMFEGFIVSSLVGYEKPRREIFDAALEMAGRPARAFMVGDNPKADIEGGKAAGLITVLVHKNGYDGADFCFEELSSVPEIL